MAESATLTAGQKASQDVAALIRARNSLLWVVTREEARAERHLANAAKIAGYVPTFWDCATGISDELGRPKAQGSSCTDPGQMLQVLRSSRERSVWILRDLPTWLRDPTVLRGTRSLARALPQSPRDEARAMVILTPSAEVPPELAGHAIVVDWPLPDRAEVAEILDLVLKAQPPEIAAEAAPNGTRDAAIDAAVGLTAEEIQSCYAKSLVQTRKIDPVAVSQEKRRVISREKVLEWFEPLAGGLDAVGGLDGLKSWLQARRSAFGARARAYGLPPPKGVLLVGVSGCGKSLTAKAISTAWGMPLLRLDLGALRSKFVGESEGNIRKALKVAETVSPCVIWLDEIEKGLAGATQGAADGGVSSDAFGTILTWMQERQGSVFVVATANDVSGLPPEFLRKGRFDEVFFVDLPNPEERVAVLTAAMRALKVRSQTKEELPMVATVTAGFTGAEIAALVPEAMYRAFADGERMITATDLMEAAVRVVPLSRTAAEKIQKLREWAKERARPATTPEDVTSTGAARALDL